MIENDEEIINADLPIVDPHHHLWCWPRHAVAALPSSDPYRQMLNAKTRYLLDEFLTDINSGHNVRASVCIEAHTMYRLHGPECRRSIGEVEFFSGSAAMAESGTFGSVRACAGIVGNVDLRLGDAVEEILGLHVQAGGGRYRGVRTPIAYDEDPVFLSYGGQRVPHILLDDAFRAGFRYLSKFDLSFDAWVFEPQIPELIDLAQKFPDTQIVLDHIGTPVGVGRYRRKLAERFPLWSKNIRLLANCKNVAIKLGGLGMPILGFDHFSSGTPANSEQLATEWKPYIETCIEAFGVTRCMFESNFPVESASCTYPILWNAFKRLAISASTEEKAALFWDTSTHIYRLAVERH